MWDRQQDPLEKWRVRCHCTPGIFAHAFTLWGGLHASLAMRICFQLRFIIAAQQLSDACSYDFLDKSSTSTHFRHFLHLPRDYMPPNLNFTSVYCTVLMRLHMQTRRDNFFVPAHHACVYAYMRVRIFAYETSRFSSSSFLVFRSFCYERSCKF